MTVYKYYPFFDNLSLTTFGEEIRFFRVSLKLSQKELAELTGIPYHDITSWEQGYRTPKKHLQPLILKYLLDLAMIKDPNFLYYNG